MKAALFEHEQYQRIISNVKELEKEIEGLEASGKYNINYLADTKAQAKEAIQKDLADFYNTRIEEIESEMKRIESEYKTVNYDDVDPMKELLKRQDWERQLKLADDEALKERVNEFKKTGEGEKAELEMLLLEVKQRGLQQEALHLNAYMKEYGIFEPHLRDETYRELSKEYGLIRNLQWSKLFYFDDGSGDFEPYTPSFF